VPVGELLHHRVDALGLLQGIVDDLLQIDAVAGSLREVMALLLELVHIEHQRRQRPIEFTRDGGCGFLGRPGARAESGTTSALSADVAPISAHLAERESLARWS
jgi:hypothetical protein